jgi:hypothetical protein
MESEQQPSRPPLCLAGDLEKLRIDAKEHEGKLLQTLLTKKADLKTANRREWTPREAKTKTVLWLSIRVRPKTLQFGHFERRRRKKTTAWVERDRQALRGKEEDQALKATKACEVEKNQRNQRPEEGPSGRMTGAKHLRSRNILLPQPASRTNL